MINVNLIGQIIYTAEISEEEYNAEGFDLQKWAEKEFYNQCETFSPDKYEFKEVKEQDEE